MIQNRLQFIRGSAAIRNLLERRVICDARDELNQSQDLGNVRSRKGYCVANFVPQKVFADREKRVKNYLEEADLEALIVTTPENFYVVSGFHLDVAPWERPVAAVIPADGDPFLIMNELSTNHLKFAEERGTLYIKDYEIYIEHPRAYPRTYTVEQWPRLLAEKLRSRGI